MTDSNDDVCASPQILQEILQHKIKIYEFPDSPDDDEEAKLNTKLKSRVPFAVVGSNTVLELEELSQDLLLVLVGLRTPGASAREDLRAARVW